MFRNVGFIALSILLLSSCGSKQSSGQPAKLDGLTLSKEPTLSYIDFVNDTHLPEGGTAHVPKKDKLSVAGWAVDVPSKKAASRVIIEMDGSLYTADYGQARPDVASVLKDSSYEKSGYIATLPVPQGSGEHTVALKIVDSKGTSYYNGVTAKFVLE